MEFDKEVEQALREQVPLFFRKAARKGLAEFAQQKGASRVTMEVFNEAKQKFLSSKKESPPGGPPKADT